MSDSASPGLPALRHDVIPRDASVLHPDDQRALADAMHALEHSNLATRLASALGRQLGSLNRLLPPDFSNVVNNAAEKAIAAALSVALGSLNRRRQPTRHSRLAHQAAVAVTGAAGGFFGLASLPIELPLSTIVMLRAIAGIAQQEGEDLGDPETAFACLQVFALGAQNNDGDFNAADLHGSLLNGSEFEVTEGGYFAVRALLAKAVSEAGRYAVERGISDQAAPVLLRLISLTSARFGIVVSQKLAAQAIPVIGAAGGAAVNYAFAAHFQSIASGHFTIRRLERFYGSEIVRSEYDKLRPARNAS